MARAHKNISIQIKVRQDHNTVEHNLKPYEKFTIGRTPDNDVVLYGENYPKKHALIECGRDCCTLNLREDMSGEIVYQESRISFQDLFVHKLLPQKGDLYQLKFSHGRSGKVKVGDASIEFRYNGIAQSESIYPSYGWDAALKQTFAKDLLFKLLLMVFFIGEIIFSIYIRGVKFPPAAPSEVAAVQKRFAKFVMSNALQQPQTSLALRSGTSAVDQGGTAPETGGGRKTQSSGDGGGSGTSTRPVGSQGLLGLIGGTGESAQSSSVVDFLVGEGLVQQLDQLMGRQTFVNNRGIGRGGPGRGTGSGSGSGGGSDIDDLVNFGASGGIDDLISDVSGVGTVQMKKQGQVNIETPTNLRGSQTAKGYRTVASVMTIINNQYGRMMYTYNKYLKTDPELRGKLSLDISIESDGRVSNLKILETTLTNQDFIEELLRIIRGLRFDSIPEGSVTVYVPLVFNKVG